MWSHEATVLLIKPLCCPLKKEKKTQLAGRIKKQYYVIGNKEQVELMPSLTGLASLPCLYATEWLNGMCSSHNSDGALGSVIIAFI